MLHAVFIPGFNPERRFSDEAFNTMRQAADAANCQWHAINDQWQSHTIQSYANAVARMTEAEPYQGLVVGHSVGALVALVVSQLIEVEKLVICSPSALFAEDING